MAETHASTLGARNTKIVATLGPASSPPEMLRRLVENGVDVVRLNASHGSPEQRVEYISTVRQVAAEVGKPVGILLDLQGPKIRLGQFENGGTHLAPGARFTLTTEQVPGTSERAFTTYSALAKDVKPGDRILLADGALELRVLDSDAVDVHCEVVTGGWISDRKGINLPGVSVSTSSLTRKDKADLLSALEAGVDMIALSFVRKRDDMLRLRHFLEEMETDLPIIAKIEKPEAWTNLDEIIEEADGVMVARGDLGVEMALEKVPFIQKRIIEKARNRGRFVITATQMLESMIESPVPTRAEVSDVANAIYDGTDAVMLSAETSTGKFPYETVRMMARVAREAEATLRELNSLDGPRVERKTTADVIADAAFRAARDTHATAICVFTSTGSSARLVARYRPLVPIYAFTPSHETGRKLAPIFGVRSIEVPGTHTTDEMLTQMDRILVERSRVKPGDKVVFVAGQPIGVPGATNLLKLHTVR